MAMQSLYVMKSINGIPLWITAPSDGEDYLLTQDTEVQVLIPTIATAVLLSYSAGATVKSTIAPSSVILTIPTTSSGSSTTGRYNVNGWIVKQDAGNDQYLHLISANVGDIVCVTWYNGAF